MTDDDGFRQLAAAVIVAAVRDLREGRGNAHSTAYYFLNGSATFTFWCQVAEVNPMALREKILKGSEK